MIDRLRTGQASLAILIMVGAWTLSPGLAAQGNNSMVEGTVKDPSGNIVVNAVVTIKSVDGVRSYTTKTDKKGKYLQIGLQPDSYIMQAVADTMWSQPNTARLPVNKLTVVDLPLVPKAAAASNMNAGADAASAEIGKREDLTKKFNDAVLATNAKNYDVALARFNEVAAAVSACHLCYKNMGFVYAQKKEWALAEEAYKKAIDLNMNPDAEAYSGLAAVYTVQKKYELAAEASANASKYSPAVQGISGNPTALYTQGMNLYNANKMAEAKAAFQAVVKADPNHAEAHYMLGLTSAGDDMKGAVAELEAYLKLMPQCAPLLQDKPTGSDALKAECAHAVEAKSVVSAFSKPAPRR